MGRMRGSTIVLVLVLGACNRVFGLTNSQLVDDAPAIPPDAAPKCPPFGTAPRFSKAITQVLVAPCFSYTTSGDANLAVASCNGIAQGPIDGALSPATAPPTAGHDTIGTPRIYPEGDAMIVQQYLGGFQSVVASVYRRTGGNVWTFDRDLPVNASSGYVSSASRGPDRRVITDETNGVWHEWAEDSTGNWTELVSHRMSNFASVENSMDLSPDGLRLVFRGLLSTGGDQILYADRPTRNDTFSAPVRLDVPLIADAFLTEDCGRLYFSALDSIFYLRQL